MAWIYVPLIIAGLGRGGLNYIPWNVYNYMADVDEIVTGRRREGAFAGVMTFVRKPCRRSPSAVWDSFCKPAAWCPTAPRSPRRQSRLSSR